MSQPQGKGKPILIFPAGMPRSLEYLERCQRNGQAVIGSSSLAYDISRTEYPAWAHLPYVTDPEFKNALRGVIIEHGIGGIYTPNPVAWTILNNALQDFGGEVVLVNAWPVDEELSPYRAAIARARQMHAAALPLASSVKARAHMPEQELSALLRHASTIPGMCDDEKIGALCEIARHCTSGDVVEIGSAYGKSAFVLAQLAGYYGIGKTLCVDPWKSEYLVQHDAAGLVDESIASYDPDETLRVFEINLRPYNKDNINYLRLPSSAGAQHYGAQREVHSDAFGTTRYSGGIALLHIDGNHHYDSVFDDARRWSPYLVPGAWIVFDDYIWPYGDGPKRVGDEFLAQHGERISSAFVMGTALFLQMKNEP